MIEKMSHLHQYVPTLTYTENVSVSGMEESVSIPRAIFHKILFGGDQQTKEPRGSGSIQCNPRLS